MITFQFDQAKSIEVIIYLAQKIATSDRYGICKLLYLADKTSLQNYGRFLFGESYVAMKEGATPSHAYDLIKSVARDPIDGFKVEGNAIIPLRDPDMGYLSQSDIDCLDHIIGVYGRVSNQTKARDDAHDKAWEEAWAERGSQGSARMPVESIAALLANSDDLIDYLSNRDAA